MMVILKIFVDRPMGKAMRHQSGSTNGNADGNQRRPGDQPDVFDRQRSGRGRGILIALDFKVYATMGTMTGLKAFVAAVFGGIGNITGAMVGGILLGILETFGVAIFGIPSGLKDTIAFGVLIIILLVKPAGLLGKDEKEKV